jgi:hypothetical protein
VTRIESSFSGKKEAKRLLRPGGSTAMGAMTGNARAGAERKSLLVLFFRKELLPPA